MNRLCVLALVAALVGAAGGAAADVPYPVCGRCYQVCDKNGCHWVCPDINPACWGRYQELRLQARLLRRTQFGFGDSRTLLALARLEGQMANVLALLELQGPSGGCGPWGCPAQPLPPIASPFWWGAGDPSDAPVTIPSPSAGGVLPPSPAAPPQTQPVYGTPPRLAPTQPPAWSQPVQQAAPWVSRPQGTRAPGVVSFTSPR
jgi:hypothetical protein